MQSSNETIARKAIDHYESKKSTYRGYIADLFCMVGVECYQYAMERYYIEQTSITDTIPSFHCYTGKVLDSLRQRMHTIQQEVCK
jgi:hypothetical protein